MKKIVIGLCAGFISGFFGAGGGLILVPALVYLFCVSEKEARATSTYAILPMVLISGIYYYHNSFIDISLGIKTAMGGMIGAVLGAILLKRLSNNALKIIFLIFLIYMGIRMILN